VRMASFLRLHHVIEWPRALREARRESLDLQDV